MRKTAPISGNSKRQTKSQTIRAAALRRCLVPLLATAARLSSRISLCAIRSDWSRYGAGDLRFRNWPNQALPRLCQREDWVLLIPRSASLGGFPSNSHRATLICDRHLRLPLAALAVLWPAARRRCARRACCRSPHDHGHVFGLSSPVLHATILSRMFFTSSKL